MDYCLDSNVYIEAYRRYYAFDIAPGFWDSLLHLAEQQKISSPQLVYDELSNSEDILAQWAKANKGILFADADEATQNAYQKMADLVVATYHPQHVQVFLAGADPWVIAYAKAHHLTVVTMEGRKNEQTQGNTGKIGGKVKIPNICERVSVKYTDTFGLLRTEKVVLR